MKRKVIRQGHNAYTITLPSKWTKTQNIQPKDFLNIEEMANVLLISTDKGKTEISKITFDISNLSSRAIDRVIRSLYKKGVDELTLTYTNKTTLDQNFEKQVPVFDIIQYRLTQLINFEIIEQGDNYVKIHDVASSSSKEFYPMVRRAFLILKETGAVFLEGIEKKDYEKLKSIKLKHDIISKFVIFCIRILNKEGHKTNMEGVFNYNPENIIFYYYNIQALHELADVYNELSKFLLESNATLTKSSVDLLKNLIDLHDLFYRLFYKFDIPLFSELVEKRFRVEKKFIEMSRSKLPAPDLLFAGRIIELSHRFAFMVESELAIRTEKKE